MKCEKWTYSLNGDDSITSLDAVAIKCKLSRAEVIKAALERESGMRCKGGVKVTPSEIGRDVGDCLGGDVRAVIVTITGDCLDALENIAKEYNLFEREDGKRYADCNAALNSLPFAIVD